MNKNDIILKIKKLLRLGESSNEHEAQLAIQKAKALLDKFNISISELTEKEIQDVYNKDNVKIVVNHVYKRLPLYKDLVSAFVADFFDCKSVRDYPYMNRKALILIGFDPDITIAKFAYDYIIYFIDKEVKRIRDNNKIHGRSIPRKLKLSYTCGFLEAIENNNKLLILKRVQENKTSFYTTINKDKMLAIKENVIANTFDLLSVNNKMTHKVNRNVFDAGYDDGMKKFFITNPIETSGVEIKTLR